MSTEPFELRARKLYQEAEKVSLKPGDTATVNRRQVRFMRSAISQARTEGRITPANARTELAILTKVREHIDREGRPVAISLSPATQEYALRERVQAEQRKRRKAEKKARAAGRPKKHSKQRKRRR